jgi:hypothetical protein
MLSPIALKRALIAALIGLVLGALITEVPFLFLRETARAPMQVLLTIPKGTSELVARGEQPPSIPATMKFVVGANASARLPLDEKDNLAFECSFQANNTLGLDIYEPLTPSMRILGMTSTGLPMAILFGLYALVMPVKKKEDPLAA